MKLNTLKKTVITSLILILMSSITGCSLVPISSFDPQTEERLMSLSNNFTGLSVDLTNSIGLPESGHEHHKETYKKIHQDVAALSLRVMAIQKNQHTQEQVALLASNIKIAEELHKKGFGETAYATREVISLIDKDITQALGAILKLEMLKKRGIEIKSDNAEI